MHLCPERSTRGNLITPVTTFANIAFHHRVAECVLVAARLPNGAIHQDRAVHADHVITLVHHHVPPKILEVALQFDAKRSVIPEAIEAAVNFARLENEAAPLT